MWKQLTNFIWWFWYASILLCLYTIYTFLSIHSNPCPYILSFRLYKNGNTKTHFRLRFGWTMASCIISYHINHVMYLLTFFSWWLIKRQVRIGVPLYSNYFINYFIVKIDFSPIPSLYRNNFLQTSTVFYKKL